MDKKLPGVFANRIERSIDNNSSVYYSANNEKVDNLNNGKGETKQLDSNLNVNQKINKIFNSTKYVYKADVRIYLRNEQIDCRIIGKNATHLITMDNKLIPISDIIDINFLEK